MKPKEPPVYIIAYKWVSYCIAAAFICYWLFTLGYILFRNPVQVMMPRPAGLYKTFLRQEWRLFEIPKNYNREMKLVVRDKQYSAKADTIDLVQYLVAQKRKYAPFNNYEDALERLLFNIMNRLEGQLYEKKALLQKNLPNKSAAFYMQQVSQLTEADTANAVNLQNIIAFGKHILAKEKTDTAGKEYQLIFLFKYIPPQNIAPPLHTDEQTIFITSYRNF
jgi:hypothetical protein